MQLPEHPPAVHRYWHTVPVFCQAPFASQVCGWSPLHCLVVGEQAVQVPPLQTLGQAAPMFCQAPAASQTCGCRFTHFFAVGVQLPEHAPLLQTN